MVWREFARVLGEARVIVAVMPSRLPLVDPADPDLPPEVREIVDRYGGAENFAGLPNIMRAVANHPGAARIVAEAGAVLYGSGTLTPAQRELAYLTASVVNNCHY
jgi:alkylhydroperoxidase family enzyme